ncbi:hypothetical protein [Streptomyces sp. NPDC094472]|uniref:hypothetical protein n=1 Tax=unclassified Streptomyces TaxID=2593676 RepID=UPI0033190A79
MRSIGGHEGLTSIAVAVAVAVQWLALTTSRPGPRVVPPRLDGDSDGRAVPA